MLIWLRQPSPHLAAVHRPGACLAACVTQPLMHRFEIGAGHGGDAAVLLDRHNSASTPMQGFAGHSAAAAA